MYSSAASSTGRPSFNLSLRNTTPEPLFSRAFLTLAYGGEKEFRTLVDKYPALAPMKPFYLVYELDRK